MQPKVWSAPRAMTAPEIALAQRLAELAPNEKLAAESFQDVRVRQFRGVGIATLRNVSTAFDHSAYRTRPICDAYAADRDGVDIITSLFVRDDGLFFELEIWKGDGSAILNYPRSEDIRVR